MKRFYTLVAGILVAVTSYAQSANSPVFCGTNYFTEYNANLPENQAAYEQSQAELAQFEEMMRAGHLENRDGETVFVVPTVVHIVHNYGPEFGVTDDDVRDMIRRMNDDFVHMSSDNNTIVSAFADIVGTGNIRFELARKDPSGNCTNGITRHVSPNVQGDNATKAVINWPRSRYYKIWVSRGAGGPTTLGYFAGVFNAAFDGIMVRYTEVNYQSRTMTHETGHWLNLPHTWGGTNTPGIDGNCSDDDGVADTPNTRGSNFGCITGQISCGSLDNVQNYMDYSSCPRMFTEGQVTRMRTFLQSTNGQRNFLINPSIQTLTGVNNTYSELCSTDFTANQNRICQGGTVTFSDLSYHDITERTWNIPGGTIINSENEGQRITVQYNTPGIYNVSLTVTAESNESNTETKDNYIFVSETGTGVDLVFEDFENISALPNNDWEVNSLDSETSPTWIINNSVGFESSSSAFINNFNKPADRKDDLIYSKTLDADLESGLITIEFDYAFAGKATSNTDALRIFSSTDCGETWSQRGQIIGGAFRTGGVTSSNFVPNASQWGSRSYNIIAPAFVSGELKVRFEFTSGGGNNLYIDNINIYNPATLNTSEFEKANFSMRVYPNPANSSSVLDLNTKTNEPVLIDVIDISGRVIATMENSNNLQAGQRIYHLSDFIKSSGIYFIRLNIGDTQKVEKVIMQ